MEKFFPVLIFIIIMIVSLLRAVRDAQRTREQQERQLAEQEEQFPPGRGVQSQQRVIPEEEERPKEIPETLTEAREIFRKVLIPERPKTSTEREEPVVLEEAPITDEERLFEEAVAQSISEELIEEKKSPGVVDKPVFIEPVPSTLQRGRIKVKAKLPIRGPDVVKGIIYHEILGTPLGLRNLPGNREM